MITGFEPVTFCNQNKSATSLFLGRQCYCGEYDCYIACHISLTVFLFKIASHSHYQHFLGFIAFNATLLTTTSNSFSRSTSFLLCPNQHYICNLSQHINPHNSRFQLLGLVSHIHSSHPATRFYPNAFLSSHTLSWPQLFTPLLKDGKQSIHG